MGVPVLATMEKAHSTPSSPLITTKNPGQNTYSKYTRTLKSGSKQIGERNQNSKDSSEFPVLMFPPTYPSLDLRTAQTPLTAQQVQTEKAPRETLSG